jgi:hypothetical protein
MPTPLPRLTLPLLLLLPLAGCGRLTGQDTASDTGKAPAAAPGPPARIPRRTGKHS